MPEHLALFTEFETSLTANQDRALRIAHLSREITSQSKRLIFFCLRASSGPELIEEGGQKLAEIHSLFDQVAIELQGHDRYRHSRNIAPGLEEYIEAVVFFSWLTTGSLISREGVQDGLVNEQGQKIEVKVTCTDYLLGVADFTGEMMRFAINCVGSGMTDRARDVCSFLRRLTAEYETVELAPLQRKMEVMRNSLEKVEKVVYALTVRGSEYPSGMLSIDEGNNGE